LLYLPSRGVRRTIGSRNRPRPLGSARPGSAENGSSSTPGHLLHPTTHSTAPRQLRRSWLLNIEEPKTRLHRPLA